MRKTIIVLCFFLLTSVGVFAACPDVANSAGYIRQGAANTTGADWNAAFTQIPATLSRGCTYYVAAGTYNGHTFNTATSGTTTITIKAATIALHGTATGWSDAFQGQAAFNTTVTGSVDTDIIIFTTGYWIFDGSYRNADWISGYGFKLDNSAGVAHGAAMEPGPNTIIRYVDAVGSQATLLNTGTWNSSACSASHQCDNIVQSWGVTPFLIEKSYLHQSGEATNKIQGPGGGTWQYNAIAKNWSGRSAGVHSEHWAVRNSVGNITIRYNKIFDPRGTGMLVDAGGNNWPSDNANGPLYVYGNVIYLTGVPYPVCDFNGLVHPQNSGWTGDIYYVNNTAADFNVSGCTDGGGSGTNASNEIEATPVYAQNVVVKNNLWFNNDNAGDNFANPAFSTTTGYPSIRTVSNNDSAVSNSPQLFSNEPARDFHLVRHTTGAGTSIANVGTYFDGSSFVANTFNVDMDGVTRSTWDQGAFEFTTSGGPAAPVLTLGPITMNGHVKIFP